MGQTRTQFIPGVSIPTNPLPYPRYIGEILSHPFIQNTLLEVLEVWDGSDEVWGNLNEPIPFSYGSEYNPIVRDWNTPPPRRDESSKYPIYKCRINGIDQWIVFKWILLDENRPTDLLGYNNIEVASGNSLYVPPSPPEIPKPIRIDVGGFSSNLLLADASYTLTTGDPDANAVIMAIEATGISLDSTKRLAIQNRVVNAKADGVWAKWLAYYGFVGGTAASHAINWKNPSVNSITWYGGVTHDFNGVRGNGTTGYGDTGLSMSTITFGSAGMGFYSTDVVPNAGIQFQMGAALAGSNRFEVFIFGGAGYLTCGTDAGFTSAVNNNSKQYFSGNSIGTTGKTYKNGSVASTGTLTSATLSARNIWLLASNRSDTPYYSTARLGSACINTGLTDAEETANYLAELAFQTALGRN